MFEFAPWSSSHRTRVRITKNAQYLPSLAIALNLLDSCYIPDSSKIRSNSIQNLKNRQNGKASGLQNRTIAKDLAVDFETDTADPTGLCASCRVTKPVRLDFLWRSCVRFCKIPLWTCWNYCVVLCFEPKRRVDPSISLNTTLCWEWVVVLVAKKILMVK